MSWTEWTDTSFRGLNLKELKVDEAFFNVSNAFHEQYFLYALSEECEKCPFKKLKHIKPNADTVIKLEVARNLELRLFKNDFGEYAFANETSTGLSWSAQPDLGQFGVYDLRITSSEAIIFETAKDPVNIYTCRRRSNLDFCFKLSLIIHFIISALIFVAAILVAFFWICKGVNRFYFKSSADRTTSSDINQESPDNELDQPKTKKRLKSLDIFRGIAIVLMIFVNSGGGNYWWIEHATWNGLHFADLVFPWFLFIMGVCIPMSIKSQVNRQIPKKEIITKVIKVSSSFKF